MSEPVIDTTGWTIDQLRVAISQLNGQLALAQQEAASDADARKAAIAAAVTDLDTLLGAPDEPKGLTTIRGVRHYTGEEMVAGAHVTFPLILAALEIITDTTLDLAKAVGDE